MADTWEERMSARAHERWMPHRIAEDSRWRAEMHAAHRAELVRIAGYMTLGQAREYLSREPWACACRGRPDCCMDRTTVARALIRAAHIAVKLVVDHAKARSADG